MASNKPSPPSNNRVVNSRVCVPAWLFVVLVLVAAGVNLATAFLPTPASCP